MFKIFQLSAGFCRKPVENLLFPNWDQCVGCGERTGSIYFEWKVQCTAVLSTSEVTVLFTVQSQSQPRAVTIQISLMISPTATLLCVRALRRVRALTFTATFFQEEEYTENILHHQHRMIDMKCKMVFNKITDLISFYFILILPSPQLRVIPSGQKKKYRRGGEFL